MLRLSLATRITMIVIIAVLAVWTAAIALSYRAHDRDSAYPSPRQIAALVELIERTARDERQLVLAALGSSNLEARIERGSGVPARDAFSVDETLRQSYAAALGGRPLAIGSLPASALQRRFPRLYAIATNALEFRIELKSGETLVIDTKSPLAVTRIGLPVGFGAGLLGTIIALVALLIMHRETRPIMRLAAAVDRMDPTGEPVLLPQTKTNAPEIHSLVQAFNRLQTRLAQLLRARMAMLGGISHDVRTFATRLRLRVDQLPDPAERERAISDISDMIRLLDDALLASRAGAGELAEELVEFDQVVAAEVEDRRAAKAPVDFDRRTDTALVLGDRLALRRVVANLIDNAIKYGRVAHVALDIDAQSIVLTIEDEGRGVPPDQREVLLEPFVRLESSRNRRTGGAGLGLAIVRNLVDAHGGTITIGDAPTGGARFMVRLPRFESRA